MFCKNLLPGPALKEFVRNYKIMDFKFQPEFSIPYKHRPPRPEQGLVFYIKGSVDLCNPKTGDKQTPAPVSIFSHQTEKKQFRVSTDFLMFTIFFQPGVLHRLLGIPMLELNHNYFDAELFFGREIRNVKEQLDAANDYELMVVIIEKFLLGKFKKVKNMAPVDAIASNLLSDPTAFSLDTLAKNAFLSSKQFYRLFVQRIGISPKFYSRITRFNQAYQFKIAHPNMYWSAIALDFSYTDYHHLEKECKEFTGLTPNEWVKENQTSPEKILRLK